MKKRTFIDLSVAMKDTPAGFFPATKVTRISHEENAKKRAKEFNLPVDFFPDSTAAAYEMFEINAHSGTHLDAPWHFGPKSMGRPSKTIDEIPYKGNCYLDSKGTLKKNTSGDVISISLSGKIGGGTGPSSFVFSGSIKTTLTKQTD